MNAILDRIVLEFGREVRSFSAICPELPGCASAGDTEKEALQNIEEAIRLYLQPAELDIPGNAKLLEVTIG
ncbi:MAG: type II toxin-antitoxin system HicB family antitoxin [Bryobacteraceae bacterium]